MEQVNWAPEAPEKDLEVLRKKLEHFFRDQTPELLAEACRSSK